MKITLGQPYSFWQLGKRGNQEDCRFPGADVPQECDPFFVVCDGVGGSEKGEVASSTVCRTVAKALDGHNWNQPFTAQDFAKVLEQVYAAMTKASTPSNVGMATTLTFVAFNSDGCLAAHMGDSRIYQVRPGVGILYRSDDHSLVNVLVHSGNLSPDEAENHPKSNVITRCISVPRKGEDPMPATVLQITDIAKGDYFFLCSDGVLKCVDDDTLVEILSDEAPDTEKIDCIANLSRDSDDNNTAYLIPVVDVEKEIGISDTEPPVADNVTARILKKAPQAEDVSAEVEQGGILHSIKGFLGKIF